MTRMPPTGTSLDAALRIASELPTTESLPAIRERDRYAVVESDPSQDAAVKRSRSAPAFTR